MANVVKLKRGSGSDPQASDLVVGEVAIRTDNGKLFTKKDNGSVAEISGGGIEDGDKGDITVSNSGATFTIDDNAVTLAKMQNVITDTILGRTTNGTGDLEVLSAASVRGIINVEDGATADQTASDIKTLLNSSGLVNAQIDASAAIAGTKISPDFGSQNVATTGTLASGNLTITSTQPFLSLQDSNNENDFEVGNAGGLFRIRDVDAAANRLTIASDGTVNVAGNLDVGAGLDLTGALSVTGNIGVSGTVDGRDVASDGSKLDGIESGATADQTNSEIKTAYEANSNTNAFTDALLSKLNGIAASATNVTNNNQLTNGAGYITATLTNEQVQDIVGAMVSGNTESGITVTYQDGDGTLDFSVASQTDNNFTNADHSKLDGIESGATADQTASEILTLLKTVDGAGSGLDADLLDGYNQSDSAGNNTIVRRNANGYIFANYFNTTPNTVSSGVTQVCVETGNDGYIRHGTAAAIRSFINVENGATADQSASEILTAIKTVDGASSGLDADMLDGLHASTFLRGDTADTASGDITFSGGAGAATIAAGSDIRFNSGDWTGNATKIQHHSNRLYISGGSTSDYSIVLRYDSGDKIYMRTNGTFYPANDSSSDLGTSSKRWANLYADTLYGDGSNLTGISAGASGGGSDEIFWCNGQNVTSNYTIPNGKNAMSAGPVTINSGVTVTIGSGETWTVV